MKRSYFFLTLLLALCGNAGLAQQDGLLKTEYSYRRYTSREGLPSMIATVVFKDSHGLLWQGTLKGSSNFDGFNFTSYAMDQYLYVERIEEENGQIRFFRGDEMFYPATQKLVVLSDTLSLCAVNSYLLPANHYIFENKESKKYFVKVAHDTITEVMAIPQLQGLNRCKAYLDVPKNMLYIPDNSVRKVHIYNFRDKTAQTIDNVLIESFLNHSRLGLLGIGSDGIYKIKDNSADLFVPVKFEMQNKTAKEMRNGDIYVKDFYNIYRISGQNVEHLYRNPSNVLWDLTLDEDENLWVATTKGLFNFFHFDFKNYTVTNHNIQSITQNNDGTYWFAGDNLDIFRLENGVLKAVEYPLNYNSQIITFSTTFSHNNLTYFLMTGGILIHDNNRFYWAEVPGGNQNYKKMVAYRDNLIVIGGSKFFEITPSGKIVKTFSDKELLQNFSYGLAVDATDRIIVGGDDGISIIENDNIRLLKNENSAITDNVCVDNHNRIFAASNKYLNLVTGDTLKTIHSFDNDYIMGLLPFDDEYLIITTLKGFYIFNTKTYFDKNEIKMLFYNQNNGMDAIEPLFREIILDREGKVWMVTSEKIVHFDLKKLLRQVSKPNLMVQNFAVSTDNVQWENVTGFANAGFSHRNRNFKFSVIGLNYSAVENVRYHYRLLGFQNVWSEPVKQREITFNNLPPGNYVFEIYADAGTDESRCDTQSFAFSIKPAFWQTTWFLVLCIAFLLLSGAGVAIAIQQRRNRALWEKLRAEKELNELRISSIRLKAIPHFNANILAAIEYYIANRTREEVMRILDIYSDFTYKTLSEVDKAARPLSEELAYVKMYLDLEKIRFMEKFDFSIQVEDGVDEAVQLPNMILHTYCENAVKHGLMPLESGGQLAIHVSQHGQIVCVCVEDNGVGRTYAAQNPHLHSSKQGLSILNRQIEIYNCFNVDKINQRIDDLEPGTRFTVEVPVQFSYVN